jgi:TetR/AcrR family transcriptional regulator, transcriptional repressor for nem operon
MPRPAQFDRTRVLEQSMNLFWKNGYSNTSIQQLGEQMNMRPGSLYAAFKSKRELFLQALDLYFEKSSSTLRQRLKSEGSALEGIHQYFAALVEVVLDDSAIKGCLMINTATELAAQDEEVRQRLQAMFDSHQQQFYQVLLKAQQNGELSEDKNPESLAAFLLMGIRGIRLYSQTGISREALQALVNNLLSILK